MREPLTGDAAREALAELLANTPCKTGSPARDLLATGRVVVLPEEDAPCVARWCAVTGCTRSVARQTHTADLCSCSADALLRRWMDATAYADPLVGDTRAYLEGR